MLHVPITHCKLCAWLCRFASSSILMVSGKTGTAAVKPAANDLMIGINSLQTSSHSDKPYIKDQLSYCRGGFQSKFCWGRFESKLCEGRSQSKLCRRTVKTRQSCKRLEVCNACKLPTVMQMTNDMCLPHHEIQCCSLLKSQPNKESARRLEGVSTKWGIAHTQVWCSPSRGLAIEP